VHHISPLATIGRDVNEDAFGLLTVYDASLKLEMAGPPPPSSSPGGGVGAWPPESLALPKGGRLVSSSADAAFLASFLHVMLYMISLVTAPLQYAGRLLMSPSDASDGADRVEVVEAGDSGNDDGVAHPPHSAGNSGGVGAAAEGSVGAPATADDGEPGVLV